jgi:hypothetical protein
VEPSGVIIGLALLMENKLAVKNYEEALSLFREAVDFLRNSELEIYLPEVFEVGAALLFALKKSAIAAKCLAFAEQFRAESINRHSLMARSRVDELKESLKGELGEERFNGLWRKGGSMTKEALLSLVLSQEIESSE